MNEPFDHSNAFQYISGNAEIVFSKGMCCLENDQALSLVPTPLDKILLWVMIAIPVVLTLTGLVLLTAYNMLTGSFILTLLLMLSLFYALPYLYYTQHRRQMALGPLLILEKQGGQFIMPREETLFQADQIVCLQVVHGWRKNDIQRPAAVELSLRIRQANNLTLHPVLLSDNYTGAVREFVEHVLDQTQVPVYYYSHRRVTKLSKTTIDFTDLRSGG